MKSDWLLIKYVICLNLVAFHFLIDRVMSPDSETSDDEPEVRVHFGKIH